MRADGEAGTGSGGEREQASGESGEPPVPDSESAGTGGAGGGAAEAGAEVTDERDEGAGGGSESHPRAQKEAGAAEIPEQAEAGAGEDLREEILEIMSRYPQKRSASIPVLFAVQRRWGWCDPEGVAQAASVMGVTPAYLESIASFYDLFHTDPAGSHRVLVCTNISCWMRGADELLDAFCEAAGADREGAGHGGIVNERGDLFVSGFECLGACDMAPMASIDERYYGPLEAGDAAAVVESLRSGAEVLPDKGLPGRPVAGGPEPEQEPKPA